MSNPKQQIVVQLDDKAIEANQDCWSPNERRLVAALSRATIVASPHDAREIEDIIENLMRPHVSSVWQIEDVEVVAMPAALSEEERATWTRDETHEVLRQVRLNHDATVGINWGVLKHHVRAVFDKRNAVPRMRFMWPVTNMEMEVAFSKDNDTGAINARCREVDTGMDYGYITTCDTVPLPASAAETDYREIGLKNWRVNAFIETALLNAGIIEGKPLCWLRSKHEYEESAPVYRLTESARQQVLLELGVAADLNPETVEEPEAEGMTP